MSTQPTRQRATTGGVARTLVVGIAVAALVGIVGAGQALAAVAVPDERVLERQGAIDRRMALGQRVALPPRRSSQDKAVAARVERERPGGVPAGIPRRFLRPEPAMGPGPQLDRGQVASAPTTAVPAGGRGGRVVTVAVAALLLAIGAAATWWVRQRRPQPESTA